MTVDELIDKLKKETFHNPHGEDMSISALEKFKNDNPYLSPSDMKKLNDEIERLKIKEKKKKVKRELRKIKEDF